MTDPYGSGRSGGSWGQPAPQGGDQQGAWGQGIPQGQGAYAGGGYGAPGPYGSPGAYGAPPVKRRGMVRIILGILGILGGVLGLLVGLIAGALIGAIVSLLTISSDDVTTVAPGSSITLDTGTYLVGTTDPSSTCTVTGTPAANAEWDPNSSGLPYEKDGVEYASSGQLQVIDSAEVTITCSGGGDIAVADVGYGGTLIGAVVGLGIPILLGILGIVLLISGIIGRSRSGKGQ